MQTPSSLKTLTTWRLTAFCCAFLVIILSGCSGGEPPEELLRNHMEREMLRAAGKDSPPVFSIASLEPNWVQNGETAYEGRVAMTLALGQDLFETANLAEALEKAGEKSSETALYRYAENQAQTLPEPLRGSLLERAPKPLPDSLVFIKSVTASGYTMTVNFMIRADKKAEGWTFTVLTYPEGEGPGGLPRSSFSDKALIVGSEEARKSIRAFIADTKNFAREVEEAKANQKKAQADAIAAQEKARTDAIAAKRKAILDIVKPGAVLWGVGESEDTPAERFGFIVGEGDAIGSTFSVKLLVPDEFPDLPAGKIQLRADPKHPYPLTLVLPSDVTVELDLADGKLTGPVSGANVNGEAKAFFSPITAEQLNREKEQAAARVAEKKAREEKAAAEEKARQEKVAAEEKARLEKVAAEKKARLEKAATEKKQREDAYAAALDKALAPQSGYQGSWTRSDKSGSIGLAVLSVTPNGLGASGYIFDPLAREKRKPFSATINRDLNADNALVIQTTPGQGLTRNEADTDFQRDWLARDARNALTLKLTPDGGWLGATQERVVVALRPIAGFAEELQKEAAVQKAYQDALNKGVSPGATWIGTFQCGNDAGEIGMLFEKRVENTLSGYFFNPSTPAKRKAFSGSLHTRGKDAPIAVKAERPGIPHYNGMSDLDRRWLGENLSYDGEARISDGILNLNSSSCNAVFKASPEPYTQLLAKAAAAEKAGQEAFMATIQPGARYEGTWKRNDGSGELAILFTGLRAVTVSAEIFDPAAPDTRWAYSGSVDPARKRESALILQPNSGPKVGRFPDRTTQGMLNYYLSRHQTIQLNLKDGVLAGRWEAVNAVLELKRVSAAPQVASPAVAPPRATALAVQGAAPVVTGAAQTEAPVTRTPGQYPALTLPANGKPVAAAHRVSVSGKNVRLALQILAPGKTVEAVRIDNVGGVSAAWRSDGKDGAAPLRVEDGTASLTEGKTAMSLALGEAEKLLTLTLTDNGAVAGKKTDFRVTVFFMDKSRVMCLLPG